MPAGRPSKYSEAYCTEVITFMEEGYSLTAFAAEIGVCRDTVTEWCSTYPEFSVAVKKAKAKCARWWEARGRDSAMTGQGNATSVIFGLKNMAPDDWREKSEVNMNVKTLGSVLDELDT